MNKPDKRGSIPPGFPPPPPEVGDFKGKSEQEYKEYMKVKLLREQWENSLTLYRMREREGDKSGMQTVLVRAKTMFDVDAMPQAQELASGSRETSNIDSIIEEEGIEMEEKPVESPQQKQPGRPEKKQVKKGQASPSPAASTTTTTTTTTTTPDPFVPRPTEEPAEEDDFLAKLGPVCSSERRHVFFLPAQILFFITIIVGTCTGIIAVGIVFGIILPVICAGTAVMIMLPYRVTSNKLYLILFFVAEIIAFVLCVIGALVNTTPAVFYLGIPSLAFLIAGTVIAQFFVIRGTFIPGEGINS